MKYILILLLLTSCSSLSLTKEDRQFYVCVSFNLNVEYARWSINYKSLEEATEDAKLINSILIQQGISSSDSKVKCELN